MSIRILLFSIVFASPLHAFASDSVTLAVDRLHDSIAKYSDKLDVCKSIQKNNKVDAGSLLQLRKLSMDLAPALSYLNEVLLNKCLQPERGELAETILMLQFLNIRESSPVAHELLESTRKMVFHVDLKSASFYHSLTDSDKGRLSEIDYLKNLFDPIYVYENTWLLEEK